MTKTIIYAALTIATLLVACSPEDRSAEVPFKPTVVNKHCIVVADSCQLFGEVTASPNSSLRGCGFEYGNDTLKVNIKCEVPDFQFNAFTRPLHPGTYYARAYAENGMGKSFAPDTIYFTIAR